MVTTDFKLKFKMKDSMLTEEIFETIIGLSQIWTYLAKIIMPITTTPDSFESNNLLNTLPINSAAYTIYPLLLGSTRFSTPVTVFCGITTHFPSGGLIFRHIMFRKSYPPNISIQLFQILISVVQSPQIGFAPGHLDLSIRRDRLLICLINNLITSWSGMFSNSGGSW